MLRRLFVAGVVLVGALCGAVPPAGATHGAFAGPEGCVSGLLPDGSILFGGRTTMLGPQGDPPIGWVCRIDNYLDNVQSDPNVPDPTYLTSAERSSHTCIEEDGALVIATGRVDVLLTPSGMAILRCRYDIFDADYYPNR